MNNIEADEANLESADRKIVGVQVPLWAPIKLTTYSEIGRRWQVAIFIWWMFWWLLNFTERHADCFGFARCS